MEYERIIFDFNGTLVNDRELCLSILNYMLTKHNHLPVSEEKYLDSFMFPVVEYYKKVGFEIDSGKDDFNVLAHEFDTLYNSNFPSLKLFDDADKVLNLLSKKAKLYILSATNQEDLDKEVSSLGIYHYFEKVIGIKNIFAHSKVQEAKDYFLHLSDFNPSKTCFIGDTTHDIEVSKILNCQCYLTTAGHQSKKVLYSAIDKSHIVDSLTDFYNIVSGGQNDTK